MRNQLFFICLFLTGFLLISCQKEKESAIPQEVLTQINKLGFSTGDVKKYGEDYIVEGDIRLSPENLAQGFNGLTLRVANTEQYRTSNRITGLPRIITIRVASSLGASYVAGTDIALARYNAVGLSLTFQRITSGTADITISGFNQGPSGGSINLGSSGFPTSAGNPYSSIMLNTNTAAYGSSPNANNIACVIEHEIGHCIGLRHTDYLNRAYSCGGTPINEGAVGVGAILIPGTPSTGDPFSFMLACYNHVNCAFSPNDIAALQYLY
jgi:hypothetical protein